MCFVFLDWVSLCKLAVLVLQTRLPTNSEIPTVSASWVCHHLATLKFLLVCVGGCFCVMHASSRAPTGISSSFHSVGSWIKLSSSALGQVLLSTQPPHRSYSFFLFHNKVSLCNCGYPRTNSFVNQVGLESARDLPASNFWVPGLKARAITTWLYF